MKPVVEQLINDFKIYELGYDFMGYSLQKGDIYTYHHTIIPAKKHGAMSRENGTILCGKTSHIYLHIIEGYEYELFKLITFEMLDMKMKGYLAIKNLREINSVLQEFEKKYGNALNNKGKPLIRSKYRERNRF